VFVRRPARSDIGKYQESGALGRWKPFLLSVSQQQASDLIQQLATRELQYREVSATHMILSASATSELAGQIFAKLCEVQRTVSAGGMQSVAWKYLNQLRQVFSAIPAGIAATGMMPSLSGEFDADKFRAVVDILGQVNADAEELHSEMPAPLRQSVRSYLNDGIAQLLADNLFDDSTRANAAIALARIGVTEDLADLRRLIEADIQRQKARPNATNYSNWYVRALLWLNTPDIDAALAELLQEDRYQSEAARGLLELALPPNRTKPFFGNTTNYGAIWLARTGASPPGFDAVRAKRYAQAIKQRITGLKQESASAANPQYVTLRIKDLAVLLAALDGRDSADFVIEALALPAQWDAYPRMNGIRALLMFGAPLSLGSMLAVLDPAIEHTLSQGLYNDQNLSLLIDCLALLLYSDDPGRAIARIEEVMARFPYRPYQVRDLVIAMGHTRSEAAVPFLLNLARGQGGVQNMEAVWIEALGRLNVPAARATLLSFVDPEIPSLGVNLTFDYHITEIFAAIVGEWARQDDALKRRLVTLSEGELTPTSREASIANTAPTRPSQIAASKRSKPGRAMPPPERPRSSSMTSTVAQPSCLARSASPY
jgi:hypothetical protein